MTILTALILLSAWFFIVFQIFKYKDKNNHTETEAFCVTENLSKTGIDFWGVNFQKVENHAKTYKRVNDVRNYR